MNNEEILNQFFTDVELKVICRVCLCEKSDVKFRISDTAYFIWFPCCLSLSSCELSKLLSFGKWFSVGDNQLLFIIDK